MKLTQSYLKQLITECINEQLSQAAEEAHKKGYESAGWGYWKDSSGKVVAKTQNGQLVKSSKKSDPIKEPNADVVNKPLTKTVTKKEMEDKTSILPDFVAELELDGRIQDIYDAGDKEALAKVEKNKNKIIKTISDKTLHLYNNNERFRKQMSAKDPRMAFGKYVSHWLDSELDKLK